MEITTVLWDSIRFETGLFSNTDLTMAAGWSFRL